MREDEDVQRWLDQIPFKLRRELAQEVQIEAQGLADAIEAAAPRDQGDLADSVEVRRKRNTLEFEVTVGGDKTTKEVRGGSGVEYDYAMGIEFGNEHVPAQPFAYPTARAMAPGIEQRLTDKVDQILDKL